MISLYLVVYDIIAVNVSYFAALFLRFDMRISSIPPECLHAFMKFAPFYTVFTLIVFHCLKLYNSLWQFASFDELNRIIASSVVPTITDTSILSVIAATTIMLQFPTL